MMQEHRPVLKAVAAWLPIALACAMMPSTSASAKAAPFQVNSPAFADGDVIPLKHSGNFNGCVGKNISPPLAWLNAPSAAKSFAVVLFDADGARGLGVTHWIVYGVPPSITALAENAGAAAGSGCVGGGNMRHTLAYAGPCPRPGDDFHHYLYFVYAPTPSPQAWIIRD